MVVMDEYFELQLTGRGPSRFLTLQGAMAAAVSRPVGAIGGIWHVRQGDMPIPLVRYTTDGIQGATVT